VSMLSCTDLHPTLDQVAADSQGIGASTLGAAVGNSGTRSAPKWAEYLSPDAIKEITSRGLLSAGGQPQLR